MKNYFAPEMKVIAFIAEENMAANGEQGGEAVTPSHLYNDAQFGW